MSRESADACYRRIETLEDLQAFCTKAIEAGYGKARVSFDTEAQTYHCHLVEVGSVAILDEEFLGEGESVVILYERRV